MPKPTLQSLHELLIDVQDDLKTKASNEKIEELLKEIKEKDAKIDTLFSRVDALEGDVALLKRTCVLLERKCDDNEQYSRRTSVRINGIVVPDRETGDDCVRSVVQILNESPEIEITDANIERAHRVGKPKINSNGTKTHQMIVKFKSWNVRSNVYRQRKTLNSAKVYLDLTKRRLDLKKLAIEKCNDEEQVAFAYANFNCKLALRLTNGTVRYFNSEEELNNILSAL